MQLPSRQNIYNVLKICNKNCAKSVLVMINQIELRQRDLCTEITRQKANVIEREKDAKKRAIFYQHKRFSRTWKFFCKSLPSQDLILTNSYTIT